MKKLLLLPLLFLVLGSFSAMANRTSVKISVSDSTVTKGTEVTITINVSHMGNTKTHHTDWVYLKVNGKEVKRWEYDKDSLPPDQDFTVQFKYVVDGNAELEAEGHCNIHGTAGPAESKITVS